VGYNAQKEGAFGTCGEKRGEHLTITAKVQGEGRRKAEGDRTERRASFDLNWLAQGKKGDLQKGEKGGGNPGGGHKKNWVCKQHAESKKTGGGQQKSCSIP